MPLIIEYLNEQLKAEAQYGERTVVLMQVGTFYEIYGYSPEYCTSDQAKIDKAGKVWSEPIGHAIELSAVLSCYLTYENGNEPYSISNCHKIGFNLAAIEKYKAALLANDYTTVRIDQRKGGMKGKIERYVAEVCSPTMQMDHIALNRPKSNVACVYIEYHQGIPVKGATALKYENFTITTGVSVIDIITGKNRVCEFYSKAEDQVYAVQELHRFLITHYPRELLIHIADMPAGYEKHTTETPNPYVKYLERVLELRRFERLNVYVNSVPPDYGKIAYQVEFLNKVFTKQALAPTQTAGLQLNVIQKRNERIIEEIGLERMNYGRVAYMLLLQHCYSHNAEIISRLSKPDVKWLDEQNHLIPTHNAITQLNIISPSATKISARSRRRKMIESVFDTLNFTRTNLGYSALEGILTSPMRNAKDITVYQDMTDEMSLKMNEQELLWMQLDRNLGELPDIGRLQRKLEISLITPKELALLYQGYTKIITLYVTILTAKTTILHGQLLTAQDVNDFNGFMSRFGAIMDFRALECCHIDTSAESNDKWLEFVDCPIRPGMYADLDDQARILSATEAALQQVVEHLNAHLAHTQGKKIEFKVGKTKKQGTKKQEHIGTVLTTTAAKANKLGLAPIDVNLCGTLEVHPYTTTDRIITSTKIAAYCTQIDTIRMWMRQRLLAIYHSIVEEMRTKYTFYVPIANLIAKLDVVHAYAKAKQVNNYHRPEIVDDRDHSFIEARDIRHPIIEQIIDGAYVTNDVFLGYGNEIRSNGYAIYGVNQTGKSSLVKNVGAIVMMAQAGAPVPGRVRLSPYSKIITRISDGDNLFQGQSSFAVEMTECRTILRQCDANTLVIGDEIAHGTETNSGLAITAGMIISLAESGASFMFATHMHDLLKISHIRNLTREKLRVSHLAIELDELTDNLIYNRKLRDGSGPSTYGLMVARYLGLPEKFLNIAHDVLLEITGTNKEIVDTKPSRYNPNVYMHECANCHRNKAQTELHTHHIIEQKYADAKGVVTKKVQFEDGTELPVGIMHKNAKDNLMTLCRDCHIDLHRKHLECEMLDTPNGKIIRLKPDNPGVVSSHGLTLVAI